MTHESRAMITPTTPTPSASPSPSPSQTFAFSENQQQQQQISTTHIPIMPQNDDTEQPHQQQQLQNPPSPTTLTLETERPQNSDPPHHQMEVDHNQDDVEMITPIPDNVVAAAAAAAAVTSSAPARRGPKRKKPAQLKRRAALEKKSLRKLSILNETLKPIAFSPINKTLDFFRHESLLKRVGLWDFVHMKFDTNVRTDLVAQLIATYNSSSRGSYVNGVRIGVNRADLARALRIPVKKDKSSSVNAGVSDGSVESRDEKESEESIAIVQEIVSNWMFLHEDTDTLMVPDEVAKMTKPIRDGNFEKMDWAGLIWYMMEKELSAAPKLGNCYYATYMQCLIKSQKEELLREEVKVDLEDDCDGDVIMSDRVDDVKATESEEHSVETVVDLSLGQVNVVDLKEIVENEEKEIVEKEGNESVVKEENENVVKEENENVVKEENENVVKEENENVEKREIENVEEEEKENVEEEEKENVEKDEKEVVGKDEMEVVGKDEKENVVKEEENVEKEKKENGEEVEKENVEEEEMENVEKEGNENVEEEGKEDVEKEQLEVGLAEDVFKYEENENEEDNGQLFLDGSNVGEKEPFMRRCILGEVESMDFGEQKQTQVEEGEEEGGQGEEDEEEEEEEEEPEQEQEQEGAFLLSMGGETLEGVTSANLIQGMEAVQVPFSSGVQICDDDLTADFLGSRVDNNVIPGSSSHFGHVNKREIDHENDVSHDSLNGSNKRLRTGGMWENKSSSEFDMCFEQCQHLMGKARMMYMEKEQACTELSMNQQLLLNELHKQEATIQHLHKAKFEEQQRRQREVYRLERELYIMTDLLDGYRKALKETRNAFTEYQARCPQLDVPLYKDVPGGGGLMLSTMELEKQRLKQEEEDRMSRLLIENKIKDFEAESMAKFEAHRCVVESLNDRLLNVENQIKPLRELLAKRKVSESSECAAPSE